MPGRITRDSAGASHPLVRNTTDCFAVLRCVVWGSLKFSTTRRRSPFVPAFRSSGFLFFASLPPFAPPSPWFLSFFSLSIDLP